jgi:1,4-dihydroxy-6-naphthoate synthase
MPILTLAHSPDPDDAFMWWPITGKVQAPALDDPLAIPTTELPGRAFDVSAFPRVLESPTIDTGRFAFRAFPADIERLNRHAAAPGETHALFDITALSFRAYCDVKHLYAITSCGSSFGDGFGPKVVARLEPLPGRPGVRTEDHLRHPSVRIAIPGRRTTAFLVLAMILGEKDLADSSRFVELPFEQIIPAVARGDADVGLVIHEGQVLYEQAGLSLILDVGAWWTSRTGLPLPLGANAIRRDLDDRFGAGTMREVTRTLYASVLYALAHRAEALDYTLPFALANSLKSECNASTGPSRDQVDRYVEMYVNPWTVDMQDTGRESLRRLLTQGHSLGLCPDPGALDIVRP